LSEGDLHSCVYHHLRRFLEDSRIDDWHILNKLPIGEKSESKKFPDITIVQMQKGGKKVSPIFIIELKEDIRNFKPPRVASDLKKLGKLVRKHKGNLEKTYFIYSLLDKNHTPEEINELILKTAPKSLDRWLFPIAINIFGEKQYLKEFEGFEKKLQKLRKYRRD